jgi:hypothetical protein
MTLDLLLKFATLLVIESLRSNPELYNFISYNNSNNIAAAASIRASSLPSLDNSVDIHLDQGSPHHLI